MGRHVEIGEFVSAFERAREGDGVTFIPFEDEFKKKEDMAKFMESFQTDGSPVTKCILGCAVEISLKDLDGLENLNIILVKKIPVGIEPASQDHRIISADSKVGEKLLGLAPGEERKFLNNANQETVIFLKRIETTPTETRQRFFPDL
ncbi:MAG: hypothetical protein PHG66_02315 [Candidatus Colwellbacteria bacterium]|nr:hypothetical protein [Candidatus Colwellbacteria bacterium]